MGVIERSQFTALRADAPIVLIDVRDEAAYNAGHVAGAIHVDAKQWKTDSLADATDLTHVAYWRKRIGDIGVDGNSPVVVYDDGRMTEASRVWFILQHFGASEVVVLDGGYPSLKPQIDRNEITVSTAPSRVNRVEFRPKKGHGGNVGLANRTQVMAALDNPRVQILDTRTAGEYAGTDLRKNPRGGHIPKALNLPHKQLLDADGRLKSREELARIFEEAGFCKDRPVITHCQSGGRASLAALAAERAGYRHVLNYYESFGEWAADGTCPVEKPTP
ncbi:MAG: sulfurtransferase [Phycisphaerales bacterium]|nr:sulfurtransferase [Phycisphaerales bacterium]MCB9855471.1 sulfurtransferase [Phycisphaerales bacterium]MCB9864248.1 sulfurtransferase [Phycisphaerales bacterium]